MVLGPEPMADKLPKSGSVGGARASLTGASMADDDPVPASNGIMRPTVPVRLPLSLSRLAQLLVEVLHGALSEPRSTLVYGRPLDPRIEPRRFHVTGPFAHA